jgi:hypothetical protein
MTRDESIDVLAVASDVMPGDTGHLTDPSSSKVVAVYPVRSDRREPPGTLRTVCVPPRRAAENVAEEIG